MSSEHQGRLRIKTIRPLLSSIQRRLMAKKEKDNFFCGYSKEALQIAAADFPRNNLLAQWLGISRSYFYAKLKDRQDVVDAIKKARVSAVRDVMKSLKVTAESGNVTAQIYYLKINGINENTVEMDLDIGEETLSDSELMAKQAYEIVGKALSGDITIEQASQLIDLQNKVASIHLLPASIAVLEAAEKAEGAKR